MLDHLDLYGCHLVDDSDSSVYRGIVLVKPPAIAGLFCFRIFMNQLRSSMKWLAFTFVLLGTKLM